MKISAGASHSLFLNVLGQVFGCGKNDSYQITIPVDMRRIIQISAGFSHSLFLNVLGQVFGCGRNQKEQLNFSSDLTLVSNNWILK